MSSNNVEQMGAVRGNALPELVVCDMVSNLDSIAHNQHMSLQIAKAVAQSLAGQLGGYKIDSIDIAHQFITDFQKFILDEWDENTIAYAQLPPLCVPICRWIALEVCGTISKFKIVGKKEARADIMECLETKSSDSNEEYSTPNSSRHAPVAQPSIKPLGDDEESGCPKDDKSTKNPHGKGPPPGVDPMRSLKMTCIRSHKGLKQ